MNRIDKNLNRDFRIKLFRSRLKTKKFKINTLIGRRRLHSIVGEQLYNKIVSRAYREKTDKITFNLRRGISITFYSK